MIGARSKWLLIATVVLFAAACDVIPEWKLASDEGNPECPHTWRTPGRVLAQPSDSGYDGDLTIVMAGPITDGHLFSTPGHTTNIPEFHDCQRLRRNIDNGERYGPLAAVFARGDSLPPVTDSALTVGISLGLVFMPQGGQYHALNIRRRYGCVVVSRSAAAARAWLVPTDDDAFCESPGLQSGLVAANELALRVGPQSKEVLHVARWEWDDSTRSQYIGLACGDAWCEVGKKGGFRSSPTYAVPDGSDLQALRMKGAYDQQRLAEWSTAGTLEAANNLGTIVPTPELKTVAATRPPAGQWVRVGVAFMGPSAGDYETELNFAAVPVGPSVGAASVLSLCRWSGSGCKIPGFWKRLRMTICDADDEGDRWVSKIERPGQEAKYLCVIYRGHPGGFTIPPVLRWRWRANDETIWVSCARGCCEVAAKK